MDFLIGGGFFAAFFLVWGGSIAFWIVSLVTVARTPEYQFRAAGTEKTTWILIVALTSVVGALVWWFGKRSEVQRFAGMVPPPPPGWYPDSLGGMRWWNGTAWTEHRQLPPT